MVATAGEQQLIKQEERRPEPVAQLSPPVPCRAETPPLLALPDFGPQPQAPPMEQLAPKARARKEKKGKSKLYVQFFRVASSHC